MEDKDSKQEGEDLGNGSEQRESEFTPPKPKEEEEEEAQTDDVDQVMRDRSDEQAADDGDAAASTESPEEAAKCNGNGSDDQTAIVVVSTPATAEESNDNTINNNNNNNNNNGEVEGGVAAEQPRENAHHKNLSANADAVKFSTPKPHLNKNAGVVKNGFDDIEMVEAEEAGSPEDGTLAQQAAFMKELENFHREKALEFKPPKFYGELLNCLKLWRAVIRLGGYEVVTASKLWRQVGESFHPPKTCTTVSWTFRIFYEKALLEYEKHKRQIGELQLPVGFLPQSSSIEKEATSYQGPGSGRARRDAAARAMQGWHAQRLLGYGEVAEPIIKDKNINSASKREKNLKSIGSLKHKTPTNLENADKTVTVAADKQVVTSVVDIGPPADWVKINVRETKDCFEVYALVPGLLREEVRVQSDPAGRLVITGQPEQLDNPWGITPFQKVVSLPARIDPLHTSAVVSLHGRLFVRVPFEQGPV